MKENLVIKKKCFYKSMARMLKINVETGEITKVKKEKVNG